MALPLLALARMTTTATTTRATATTTTTRLALLRLLRTPHTSTGGSSSSSLGQLRPFFSTSRARQLGRFRTLQQAKSRYRSGPFSWKAGLLFLITGGFLIGYFQYERARAERERIAAAGKAVGVGRPRIGGPFVMTDMFGKRVTEEDFKGRYTLVYFGFTNCPDICPEELDKLSTMIDLVNKTCGNAITPVFITCDPARDAPRVLREYLSEFHPKIIGLTGTYDEIKSVCKAYRVYFSTPPVVKPGQDYLVDHSIYFYLMDPEGDFVEALGRQHTPQEAADLIIKYIKDWKGSLKMDDRTLYAPAAETPLLTSVTSNIK